MDATAIIEDWIGSSTPVTLCPAALRLAQRVPLAQSHLDGHLTDPLDRALAGLGDPPDSGGSLRADVLSAQVRTDRGALLDPAEAALLEQRAHGDPEWWIPAARIHAMASTDRQQIARRALARQNLPYVFPGEVHPMMVHVLAAGDRVLSALHVDWTRKLTQWMTPFLLTDFEKRGLWFWPVLESLDVGRLSRPLPRLAQGTPLGPGGLGMAVAYCHRIGTPGELLMDKCGPLDRLIAALAWASTAESSTQMR